MKKQVNKLSKIKEVKHIDKTTALKWTIIGLGIAIVIAWIGWFACDCIFISKGLRITGEGLSLDWDWDTQWYPVSSTLATITLAMTGGYIVLLLAYMVICGLNVKSNVKYYIYQIIAGTIAFVGITICIIEAAEMMVNQQWVLDITISASLPSPITFNVYHLEYLKWMCVSFGLVIFFNVLLLCSFREFGRHTIIRDCNILVIVLAAASVILFIPFVMSIGWNDPFIGGAEGLSEWIDLVTSQITWKHVVCQCVTSPMGVLAGMIMILQVIRLITVMFVYNQKWGEKKTHIIIFSVITFLTFASFIIAHANKMDFVKLVNDYNSLKLPCLLVVLAQTTSCVAAGTYCSISSNYYVKRVYR